MHAAGGVRTASTLLLRSSGRRLKSSGWSDKGGERIVEQMLGRSQDGRHSSEPRTMGKKKCATLTRCLRTIHGFALTTSMLGHVYGGERAEESGGMNI